jgi:hypothetical protein
MLVFCGQIRDRENPTAVKERVCALLKTDPVTGERLFSGSRIILKRDLSQDEALRNKSIFDRTGAISTVEPMPQPEPAAERISCPKCGTEQLKAAACAKCGVIFAKYASSVNRLERKKLLEATSTRKEQSREFTDDRSFLRINTWVCRTVDAGLALVCVLLLSYFCTLDPTEANYFYSAREHGFSINFPGVPITETRNCSNRTDYYFSYRWNNSEYYVCRSVFTTVDSISPEKALDAVRESLGHRATIVWEGDSSIDGAMAREFELELEGGKVERLKVCLQGCTLYQVGILGSPREAKSHLAASFANSFHLDRKS